MEKHLETTSFQPQLHTENRGAGGKLRRPPTRKPPATPYSRPPPPTPATEQRRWLSKLVVDPAFRIIGGGASLLFPSFFSKTPPEPPLSDAVDGEEDDRDGQESETDMCDADGEDQNGTINHEMSKSTELEGPSGAGNATENSSDLVGQKEVIKGDILEEKSLSDIELLLKGKTFSRDEVKRLMDIINSRSDEVPNKEQEEKNKNPTVTAVAEHKQPVASHDIIDITSDRKQRDVTESLWRPKTPLPQSVILDEVGASPIDIAKAYMGSRTVESGNFSKGSIQKDDRSSLYGSEFATKPFIPSPSPKPSAYWPGSMVQDQRDYLTPQTNRARYGVNNFPRTPYSRTIFSKSKSKLSQVQGDNDKWPQSSTSVQKLQTPIFGQGKSKGDGFEDNHRSLGPINKSKHNLGAQTPFNGARFFDSSSVGPLKEERSKISQGFLPPFNKNFESGATSSSTQPHSVDRNNKSFELGTPTVHPHSSQIARTILEHIDRNTPTPKDKLEELKLAAAWKRSVSSSTSSADPNGQNSLLNSKGSDPDSIVGINGFKKYVEDSAGKGNSLSVAPSRENTTSDVNMFKIPSHSDVFQSNGTVPTGFPMKSSHEKPPTSVTKPILSSISIDKPGTKWKLSSDQSSGFTFPISTASEVFSEPPTPSIMPSFSTGSQSQSKDGTDVPTYSFGSTKSEPALIFSFPSTSNAGIEIDTSDIKFSFGSDKPRLSFGSIGKNAITIN